MQQIATSDFHKQLLIDSAKENDACLVVVTHDQMVAAQMDVQWELRQGCLERL